MDAHPPKSASVRSGRASPPPNERDQQYLEETAKAVAERLERDEIFRQELEARRAMDNAHKLRQQRQDAELREASLKAAVQEKESALARTKANIGERKGAAIKLKAAQETERQRRIDECIRQEEVGSTVAC